MERSDASPNLSLRLASVLFLNVEHTIYMALGAVLSVTAAVALISAGSSLWLVVTDWSAGHGLFLIIDRLLFVLMLAEILHTVRVSIRSGSLTAEPFLIVGLIASIRRVLVITLQTSEASPGKPPEGGDVFRTSMIELGVLAGLILVMVISIYLIRRSSGRAESEPAEA